MKELKRLLPYLKQYKTRLYWGFFFVAIANMAATLAPRLVGSTIDLISSGNFEMSVVVWNIAAILGLTAVSGTFMYLTRQKIAVASRLIEYDLRTDFLTSIERKPASFFDDYPTGTLMAHATNDINAAREFLGPAVMFSANTITMVVFAMYFMLSIDVEVTLVALIPLPFIAMTTFFLGRKVHVAFRDVQSKFADLTARTQESFSGIRIIKAYLREMFESGKFEDMSRDYLGKNMKLARVQSLMRPLIMVLVGSSIIIVLAYGGRQVIQGGITLGQLTQYFIYLNLLIWPVAAIGWITNLVQRASASAYRLGRILEPYSAKTPVETDQPEFDIQGEIDFKNVTMKYYPEQPPVLNNISFKIPAKTSVGICGTVGSGKTTIANLIPRIYEPASGDIFIDGINICDIPVDQLRQAIGYVPQDPFLFSDTIAKNIRFGNPHAGMDDIINASKAAGVFEEIQGFPENFDTILGERGISLSGGQKQRVAIARAIIRQPKILILDDSLSAVDTQTEEKILSSLRSCLENCTAVIISHRISTLQFADKIIVLDNGTIIEEGSHTKLISLKGKYSEMYNQQQLKEEIDKL